MKLSVVLAAVAPLCNALALTGDNTMDRVIKLGPNKYEVVSDNIKMDYKRANKNFIDVTSRISVDEARKLGLVTKKPLGWWDQVVLMGAKQFDDVIAGEKYAYPKKLHRQDEIAPLFDQIDIAGVKSNLERFTSFYTRYYKTQSGFESAQWLETVVSNYTANVKHATVKRVKHDGWDQYSIVATIPGEVDSIVVLGAHQDSANLVLPNVMRAPGADDDGSGTVTVLEALRILSNQVAEGTFTPYHTLEFHFYSAEEGGLLGSYDVYKQYHEANKTVVGFLQQDMTGYTGGMDDGLHMGLVDDYTSPELNKFVQLVGKTYCTIPIRVSQCGYGCSDHASATEFGFPSSFVIEAEFEKTAKFVHTTLDTIDRIDFDHVKEHIRLSISFAYELTLSDLNKL